MRAASGCVARGSCSAPGGPCVLLGAGVTEGPAARCVSTRSRSMRARMCARAIHEAVVDDHAERLGEGVRFPAVVVSATTRAAALPTSRLARPRCSVRRMARSSGGQRRPPLRGDLLGGAGSCARAGSTRSCQMAMVLRPRPSAATISSRSGSHALTCRSRPDRCAETGAASVPLPAAVAGEVSVDTSGEMAGSAGRAGGRGPANPHQPTKKPARIKVNSGARSMDAATPKRCPDATAGTDQRMRARLDRWAVQRDLRAEPERQPAERAPPDGNGGAGHDGPDVGVLAEAAERLEPPCGPRRRRRPPRIAKIAHTWPASQHGLRGLIPTRPSRLFVPEGHTRCRPSWHRPDRRAPGCRCGSLLRDAARCRVDQSPAA